MQNKGFLQTPPAPVMLAASLFLALLLLRGTSMTEDPPFFVSPATDLVHIELTGADRCSGVYQFNDGLSMFDVIKLTDCASLDLPLPVPGLDLPVLNGAHYVVSEKEREIEIVQRGWMAAGKRMAMGIPLHPDRMSGDDWAALPGIGETLAKRINDDRQKNGDFSSLAALQRVKGIGPGKIASWMAYF